MTTMTTTAAVTLEILQSVQSQMEEEQTKILELEAQIEALLLREQEQEDELPSLSKEHIALQTQVDGTRQIVEALSCGRPAIAAAVRRPPNAILPLALVRLLELLPWHPTVETQVTAQDAIYEWQCYDKDQQLWRGDLSGFPEFFRALPVAQSVHQEDEEDNDGDYDGDNDNRLEATNDENRPLSRRNSMGSNKQGLDYFLTGLLSSTTRVNNSTTEMLTKAKKADHKPQPKQQQPSTVVLTNANLSLRYAVTAQEGFPLPNPNVSGTWKWIARWKIEKPLPLSPEATSSNKKNNLLLRPSHPHSAVSSTDSNVISSTSTLSADGGSLCDDDGWTYASEASHFVLWNSQQLCWGGTDAKKANDACNCIDKENDVDKENDDKSLSIMDGQQRNNNNTQCNCHGQQRKLVLRRRKWTRLRVLVDYPLASKSSQEHLRIHADNASLCLATNELAEKLQETTNVFQQAQSHCELSQKTQQLQLQRYQTHWEQQEELAKKLRYGKFKRKIAELSCSQDDILPIIANPVLFGQLQRALRQSGAITNAMLQQGIHFYIQDHVRSHNKNVQKQRRQQVDTVVAASASSSNHPRNEKNMSGISKRETSKASRRPSTTTKISMR